MHSKLRQLAPSLSLVHQDPVCVKLTCQDYGTYARWLLTETQDATFADIELGFESDRTSLGVLRAPLAKRFLRRWLEMSLVGLHRATGGES